MHSTGGSTRLGHPGPLPPASSPASKSPDESPTTAILLHHLARDTQYAMATSLLDPDNERSLTVARQCRFEEQAGLGCKRYSTPPVT
jgi:hypothetical protein